MNIQEAYNKGLDDAENQVMDKFKKTINEEYCDPFANPKMEELRLIVRNLLNKKIEREIKKEVYGYDDSECDEIFEDLKSMFFGEFMDADPEDASKERIILRSVNDVVNYFIQIAGRKNNFGKSVKKMLEEKREILDNLE